MFGTQCSIRTAEIYTHTVLGRAADGRSRPTAGEGLLALRLTMEIRFREEASSNKEPVLLVLLLLTLPLPLKIGARLTVRASSGHDELIRTTNAGDEGRRQPIAAMTRFASREPKERFSEIVLGAWIPKWSV